MSGNRFLLDTNAVIYLLNGSKNIDTIISKANWIGISVITYIEFLAFENLSDNDKNLFYRFISRIDTIDISLENNKIINKIIDIRQKYTLKLPDSIIASTAYTTNATLITWDNKLRNIDEVEIYPKNIIK